MAASLAKPMKFGSSLSYRLAGGCKARCRWTRWRQFPPRHKWSASKPCRRSWHQPRCPRRGMSERCPCAGRDGRSDAPKCVASLMERVHCAALNAQCKVTPASLIPTSASNRTKLLRATDLPTWARSAQAVEKDFSCCSRRCHMARAIAHLSLGRILCAFRNQHRCNTANTRPSFKAVHFQHSCSFNARKVNHLRKLKWNGKIHIVDFSRFLACSL
ncbi:hypothetical protein GGE12_005440 [Rhizobium mongolense]|uniref:Uncharacterized protein n=1 Tax=Rhizobium mongolense TaxID=57676 RepID=A0A7W6RS58_9HYPH|nr:hypothetical protein [Rhizobium mongolense]